MNSESVLTLAKRRGFLWPSSEIYGGIAGFYDFGPLGSIMKREIEDVWRRYYVLGEGFAEISSTEISPEEVFIASGHVNEFTDFLVECRSFGCGIRAKRRCSFCFGAGGYYNKGECQMLKMQRIAFFSKNLQLDVRFRNWCRS
jgi:glycyl-tRNA synthetase (class II)